MLTPLKENLFWFGSNYQWKFDDPHPSKEFYQQASRHLSAWLKLPYRIMEHKAGIRPATLERRPFVGLHPHQPSIGILNGMGTKGCSLAPYFANRFVQQLINNEAIVPEADIKRFSKILGR
jgi:glycine/D-amino acid oxidase-like deaminating enzyme